MKKRKFTEETKSKIVATRLRNHPPSMKRAIQVLDEVFSRYVRLSNSNDAGEIKCFTCGGYFPYSYIDCGHFVSRQYKSLRWDEKNTAPQCRKCNRFLEGVKDVFALNLQIKYGTGILQELNNKKRQIAKYTLGDITELTACYKAKIKKLEDGK